MLIALAFGIVFAMFCTSIAKGKGKDPAVWGVLGFFFGIIALIVLMVSQGTDPALGTGCDCPACNSAQTELFGGSHRCFACEHVWV